MFVYFASSLLKMLLKFWHAPDYRAFSHEDEVRATMRKVTTGPGMYHLPFCTPEEMKERKLQEEFRQGPNAHIFVRRNGLMNMGAYLGPWFRFCVMVTLFCALLRVCALPAGAPFAHVFQLVGVAGLMGYAFGSIPNAIWWEHPWGSTISYVVDGVSYALITAATFAWLWPAAYAKAPARSADSGVSASAASRRVGCGS